MGRWAVLGMVTEQFGRHIFTEVTRAREKAQLLYAGCVHFTLDWLFWNLHSPNTSDIMNFSFDNMGPLKVAVSPLTAVHKAALHSQTLL